MPSVHAAVGSPWADGSTVHTGATDLPWGDGATVHSLGGTYTPGAPPGGGTPTSPVPPVPLLISARPTYKAVHAINVVDLRDDTVLDVFDLSMSIDEDSVFWTVRASGPGSLYAKLVAGEQPAQIEVTIDGMTWQFAIDALSRAREFESHTATFTGRSITVAAGVPYQIESNWVNDGITTAAQMAAVANLYTGLEVVWMLDDWIIPDQIFTYSGTPLGVVRRVAEAVGATVTSARTGLRVTVAPRYPVMPNAWAASPVDVQIAFEAVQSETFERVDIPEYDGVYLSGQQGGIVGFVRLDGTGGAVLHPLVTELLLTEEPALRQRGAAILGASGGQARVTLVLPVLTEAGEPGVLELGQLVRMIDPDGTWYGLVRSVSVSASGVERDPRVRQTVVLERHTKAIAGTVYEPPVDPVEPEPLFLESFSGSGSIDGVAPTVAPAGIVWGETEVGFGGQSGGLYVTPEGPSDPYQTLYWYGDPGAIGPFVAVVEVKGRFVAGGTGERIAYVRVADGSAGWTLELYDGGSAGGSPSGGAGNTICWSCFGFPPSGFFQLLASNVSVTLADPSIFRIEFTASEQRVYCNGTLLHTSTVDLTGLDNAVSEMEVGFMGELDYVRMEGP